MAGHRQYILIIISFFMIISCNNLRKSDLGENTQLVKYLNFDMHEVSNTVDTIELLLTIRQLKENTIFEYKSDKRNKIYQVNFINHTGFIIQDNDTVVLHFLDEYKITLCKENDTTTIYKFVSLAPAIDYANYYFITPQLGVILKKSTTWPIFSELSQHYLDGENTFKLLLSLIYNNKDFYSDIPVKKPPPPPR